jgi:ribosome-associated heat shock protein Hsp15
MRVDRLLFFIRLVKSRTLAQSLIETGYVRIDGRRVEKSSEEVRVGSIVALPLRGEVRVLRIVSLPARRGPAPEARACYQELGIDEPSGAS